MRSKRVLRNIVEWIEDGGEIRVGPYAYSARHMVAMALLGDNVCVGLSRREDETVPQLLARLDAAIGRWQDDEADIDEITDRSAR